MKQIMITIFLLLSVQIKAQEKPIIFDFTTMNSKVGGEWIGWGPCRVHCVFNHLTGNVILDGIDSGDEIYSLKYVVNKQVDSGVKTDEEGNSYSFFDYNCFWVHDFKSPSIGEVVITVITYPDSNIQMLIDYPNFALWFSQNNWRPVMAQEKKTSRIEISRYQSKEWDKALGKYKESSDWVNDPGLFITLDTVVDVNQLDNITIDGEKFRILTMIERNENLKDNQGNNHFTVSFNAVTEDSKKQIITIKKYIGTIYIDVMVAYLPEGKIDLYQGKLVAF